MAGDVPRAALNGETANTFEAFYHRIERLLVLAMASRYGARIGREAAIDALAWAWENWDRVETMTNPGGYVYRVAQSRARRLLPKRLVRRHADRSLSGRSVNDWPDDRAFEPALQKELEALSPRQRQAVVLAHGYGYSHREIASLLEISPSSVQNHVERGLANLQARLRGPTDE